MRTKFRTPESSGKVVMFMLIKILLSLSSKGLDQWPLNLNPSPDCPS